MTFAIFYSFVVGLTSIVFMAFVFYNESFLGRGVLFVEPNRAVASFELVLCVVGMFIQSALMLALLFGRAEKKEPEQWDSEHSYTGYAQ